MSSPDLERISSFKEYVIVWKRDAERQEALVAIVAQLLDQECRKNDLQVIDLFDSALKDILKFSFSSIGMDIHPELLYFMDLALQPCRLVNT